MSVTAGDVIVPYNAANISLNASAGDAPFLFFPISLRWMSGKVALICLSPIPYADNSRLTFP